MASLLSRLNQHANAAVHDEALNPRWRQQRLATNLKVCAVGHGQATSACVGGSCCYLVRNGRAEPLTGEHSWVEEHMRVREDGAVLLSILEIVETGPGPGKCDWGAL